MIIPLHVSEFLRDFQKSHSRFSQKALYESMPDNVKAWMTSVISEEITEHHVFNSVKRGLSEVPCCPACGKILSEYAIRKGLKYCSLKCSNGAESVISKKNATLQKHYGVSSPFKTETAKKNFRAVYKTSGKEIQRKIAATNIERYGVETPLKLESTRRAGIFIHRTEYYDEFKKKLERKIISLEMTRDEYATARYLRYRCGVCGNIWQSEESSPHYVYCHQCFSGHVSKKEKAMAEFIRTIYDGTVIENCKSELVVDPENRSKNLEIDAYLPELKIGFEFDGDFWHKGDGSREQKKDTIAQNNSISIHHIREKDWDNNLDLVKFFISRKIFPPTKWENNIHGTVREFLKSIGISYTENKNLGEYTADFYIENNGKKVALFVNLLRNHKDSIGYFGRTEKLNGLGIRSIQMFESYVLDAQKWRVLKNIIEHACGISRYKIYARDTEIKVFQTPTELRRFFEENNIQGYRNAKVGYALCLKKDKAGLKSGQVVMAYTVGDAHFGKGKYDLEIARGACLLGCTVIGGASKLWKYITETHRDANSIVYYVDTNHYNGQSMQFLENLEFIKTQPGFWNFHTSTKTLKNREPNKHKELKYKTEKTIEAEQIGCDFSDIMSGDFVFLVHSIGTAVYVWNRK